MSIGFSPQRIKTIIHGKDNDNQLISNPFSKGYIDIEIEYKETTTGPSRKTKF